MPARVDVKYALGNAILAGKTAVVTGGSRNLGLACALGLAEAGADLVIGGRDGERLEAAASRIRSYGHRVTALSLDVTKEQSVLEFADLAIASTGRADVLVNNAYSIGDPGRGRLTRTDSNAMRMALQANLLSPMLLAQKFAPAMVANGNGSIVNMVSTTAFTPLPGLGTYGVSKAGLWALTKQLALELAPDVRVNAVCPGTAIERGETPRLGWSKLVAITPMGRVGAAEEVGRAVVFLASEHASYTTGSVLFVDGGRVGAPKLV